MNLATQTGITIRWRTDIATNSRVRYGTTAGNLTNGVSDTTKKAEHIIQLKKLTPNTLYYYSIGSTTQTFQGDENNYFKTLPATGSKEKVRILVMGDMGSHSDRQARVLNAYLDYNGKKFTDAWLLLGDNAYMKGLDSEYQSNFFNIYQSNLTKNNVIWPVPGNHDYANRVVHQEDHLVPYYHIFSLPAKGEAGGIASNSESYYSFNYANIHFVALDSYGWGNDSTRLYDTLGLQAKWLKKDLAANDQQWTIVYFHHPPYSKGSADSDVDSQLIKIRKRIIPILERYKTDLVLCGHSHLYERSFLINGHYGLEKTFDASAMALSTSSAEYNGSSNSCPYIKNPDAKRNGIVYANVGSSGFVGGSSPGYPHNAMQYSNNTNGGVLIIEIRDNRLDAKWLSGNSEILDQFTIMKNVNKVRDITISKGSSLTLSASWMGSYLWSNGATTRSITVSPSSNRTYTVYDSPGCLKDKFNITVSSKMQLSSSAATIGCNDIGRVTVYPNPAKSIFHVETNGAAMFSLIDQSGKILLTTNINAKGSINISGIAPGLYYLKNNSTCNVQKVVIAR
jgi:hypothetical protein